VNRVAFRTLVGIAVALGLAVGLTGTISTAQAAPATPSAVSAAAPDCSAEQATLDQANADRAATQQKLRAAKRELRKAKRALRAAKAAHRTAKVERLQKRVKRLQRKVRRLKRQLEARNAEVATAQQARDDCLAGGAASSPVQVLCDGGVPQEVCDALASLGGGTPDTLTLDALCTAVPKAQPLCDAFAGGTPDPTKLLTVLTDVLTTLGLEDLLGAGLPSGTSVQALCKAGAPQVVCDTLAEMAGGTPDGVTLDDLCAAVPQTQPLCDAFAGGTPDLIKLLGVLTDVLTALGLDGLLGGLPPLPLAAQ